MHSGRVTYAQAGNMIRIYRDGQLVAVITGESLIDIARLALAAHAEGTRT